jgi:hypothetical protein
MDQIEIDDDLRALVAKEIADLKEEIAALGARKEDFDAEEECACVEDCEDCRGFSANMADLIHDRQLRLEAAIAGQQALRHPGADVEREIKVMKTKYREAKGALKKEHDYSNDPNYGAF